MKKEKSNNKNIDFKKKKQKPKKILKRDIPTLKLVDEHDIAMDFAEKVYKKFDKMIKSIILFGSSIKHTATAGSDIDIIIIIDDAAIKFDQELMAWYRQELAKIIQQNPYKRELHINTVKLTTWWQDFSRGDPVIVNIIRYGEAMIDFGGFFNPLKVLLQQGRIKSTPEAIYTCLQRAPNHLIRSKQAQLGAIEGVYWAMVDSAHALLMASHLLPPSPEHIPILLKENFVDKNLLKMKYVTDYRDAYVLHRKIMHNEITAIKGQDIDELQEKAENFISKMTELIKDIVEAE